jgi:hypothetical protein
MTAADAITGTSAQPATAAAIVLLIFIEFLLQADACAGILVANALRRPDRTIADDYERMTQRLRTRSMQKKKITKNASSCTTPIGASQPLFSMMTIVSQKTAVAITAVRNATQTGRKNLTQPAQALGWLAGGRRAQAAGR